MSANQTAVVGSMMNRKPPRVRIALPPASYSARPTAAAQQPLEVREDLGIAPLAIGMRDHGKKLKARANPETKSPPHSAMHEQSVLPREPPAAPPTDVESPAQVAPPVDVEQPNKRSGSIASKRQSSNRMRADSPDPLNASSPPTKRSPAADLSAEPVGPNKRARRSVVQDLSSETNRIIAEAEDMVEEMEKLDGGYEGGDAHDNLWDKKKKGDRQKKEPKAKGKKAAAKPKAGKKGKAAAVPVSKELVDDSDMEVDGPPAEPVAAKAGASKEDSIVLDTTSPSKQASPAPTTSHRTSGRGATKVSISVPMHLEDTPDPAQEAADRLKALAARKSMVPEVEEEPEEEPEPVKPPPKKKAGKKGSKKAKAVPVVEEEEPIVEEEPMVEEEPIVEEDSAAEAEPVVEEEPDSPRAEPKKKGRRAQAKKKVVAESSDDDEEGKILSGEESEAEAEEEERPTAKKGKAKDKSAAKKSPAAGKKGGAKEKKAAPEPEPEFKPVDEDAMDEADDSALLIEPTIDATATSAAARHQLWLDGNAGHFRAARSPKHAEQPARQSDMAMSQSKLKDEAGSRSILALATKHTTGLRVPGLSKRSAIPKLLVKAPQPIPTITAAGVVSNNPGLQDNRETIDGYEIESYNPDWVDEEDDNSGDDHGDEETAEEPTVFWTDNGYVWEAV